MESCGDLFYMLLFIVSEHYLQEDLNVNGLVLEPTEEITAQDATMDGIHNSESCETYVYVNII